MLAPDGNFYGARMGGGAFNAGLVFRMTPDGVVTTIYDFRGGDQGYSPDQRSQSGPTVHWSERCSSLWVNPLFPLASFA